MSREPNSHGGNVIYKRLRDRGYEVFAVNPNADAVEGDTCYRDLASIPGGLPDLRRPDLPACRYSGRCERAIDDCVKPLPQRHLGERHVVSCWNPL